MKVKIGKLNPGLKNSLLLMSLTSLLLVGSFGALVWTSNQMFVEDNTALIQKMNSDMASNLAARIKDSFRELTDKLRSLGLILMQDSIPADVRNRLTQDFFGKDKDILAILIHKGASNPAPLRMSSALSPELGALGDADGVRTLAAIAGLRDLSMDAMSRGVIQFVSFKLPDGSPAVALGIPFIAEAPKAGAVPRFSHTLIAVIRQNKFIKAVNEGDSELSYLVDQRGRLLAHPDTARAASNEDISQTRVVALMLKSKANNGQARYQDPSSGEWLLGAYKLVGFNGLGVVSEMPEAKAFEAAESVKRRSMEFALGILSVALFVGFFFASRVFKNLPGKSVEQTPGHSPFSKFYDEEIAGKLAAGKFKVTGERKEAVVVVTELRGFSAMAESLKPDQAVTMLNEYMTRMTSIIQAHNGIVDKCIGTTIVAFWGVPQGHPEDAPDAVHACLAMRTDFEKLNPARAGRGGKALKMGMGLTLGPVIAGNIGSKGKLEYTAIGDAFEFASQIQSMAPDCGTDLLIPKAVHDKLKARFIFEPCTSAKIKGPAGIIELFKVRGFIDEKKKEVLVETSHSSPERESEKSASIEPVLSAHFATEVAATKAMAAGGPTKTMTASAPTKTMAAAPPPPSEAAIESSRSIRRPDKHLLQVLEPPSDNDVFMTPNEWYAQFGEEPLGPFTELDVHEGIRTGEFTTLTPVANNKQGPWQLLGDCGKFSAAFLTPAPAAISPEDRGEDRTTVQSIESMMAAASQMSGAVSDEAPVQESRSAMIRVARARAKTIELVAETPLEIDAPSNSRESKKAS